METNFLDNGAFNKTWAKSADALAPSGDRTFAGAVKFDLAYIYTGPALYEDVVCSFPASSPGQCVILAIRSD